MGGIVSGQKFQICSTLVVLDPFKRNNNTTANLGKALVYIIHEFQWVCELIRTEIAPRVIFEKSYRPIKMFKGEDDKLGPMFP